MRLSCIFAHTNIINVLLSLTLGVIKLLRYLVHFILGRTSLHVLSTHLSSDSVVTYIVQPQYRLLYLSIIASASHGWLEKITTATNGIHRISQGVGVIPVVIVPHKVLH